jgi:uncharacterized protein with von Willebrand factor type A (vWA) domain
MTVLLLAMLAAAGATAPGRQAPPPPLRIVLLVDTSDSMTSHLPFRRGDATLLTDAAAALSAALRPDESVSVASFGPTINVSPAALQRDDIVPAATALSDHTGGASPLWDALDALITALDGEGGRHAVVVVTDGRTTGNTLSFAAVLARLRQARVRVFFICAERPKQASVADPSVRLREIATATGGRYYAIRNYSGLARPKPHEIGVAIRRALEAARTNAPGGAG